MVFEEDVGRYGVADFVLLDRVDEASFLANLEKRYRADRIYTNIGDVVVAMNPYKRIPELYTDQVIKRYQGKEQWEESPHVYAVAEQAYKQVHRFRKNTCILISGESGSGKTEASKIIMNYIGAVTNTQRASEVERIKRVLLKTNVVLEAFGNAQTTRNDNSSRFGKYMDICFDFKADCSGGIINTYLLEKTRVTHQQDGERNFHIFYQLLAGANANTKKKLNLQAGKFKYLTNGTSLIRKGDAAEFKQVQDALKWTGIDAADQDTIFAVLSAVLHMGEIEFLDHEGAVTVKDRRITKTVASLLDIDVNEFELSLVSRKVRAGLDVIEKGHSKDVAESGTKALAKSLYERLFGEIVRMINHTIEVKNKHHRDTSIGVLDIYGFEILGKNGFEQFCINYCNEKLQQLFIQLVLKQEQEEYKREGIQWKHIDYFDNEAICKLIEGPMIGTLDDVKIRHQSGRDTKDIDVMLVETYDQTLRRHQAYKSRQTDQQAKHLERFEDFEIRHYAGSVVYCAKGFSDTNRDELWFDFKKCIATSRNKLVANLFPEGRSTGAQKRPQSTGSLFKHSMNALVTNLKKKQPYYVRCIKPNERKASQLYDAEQVKHQVAYLGLVENVRVRRAGFAYRIAYTNFLDRYKMLSKQTWPNPQRGMSDASAVKAILGRKVDDCVFGKTKLFIKEAPTILSFEADRRARIQNYVIPFLNRMWRGAIARRRVKRIRAANRISGAYRAYKLKTYIDQMLDVFYRASSMNSKAALHYGATNWPKPPTILAKLSNEFLSYFRGWCARGVLSQILPSDYERVRLLCLAHTHLQGKRAFASDGVKKVTWHGDYIGKATLNGNTADAVQYRSASASIESRGRRKNQAHEIGNFVSNGWRLNDKGKCYLRTLTISEAGVYKMDPAKKYKLLGGKRPGGVADGVWPLSSVSGVGLHEDPTSPLIILTFKTGPAFVFAVEAPASAVEAMAYLQYIRRKAGLSEVKVQISEIAFAEYGKKRFSISSRGDASGSSTKFDKTGANAFVLSYPK